MKLFNYELHELMLFLHLVSQDRHIVLVGHFCFFENSVCNFDADESRSIVLVRNKKVWLELCQRYSYKTTYLSHFLLNLIEVELSSLFVQALENIHEVEHRFVSDHFV